jgi:tRNA-dihydrouridine synthase B
VMVGRAAIGRPWVFAEINHYLDTGSLLPPPAIPDRLTVAWQHLREKVEGSPVPVLMVRMMRKHLAAYMHGWPDGHSLRAKLMTRDSLESIRDLFSEYLSGHPDLPRSDGDDWLERFVPLDRGWPHVGTSRGERISVVI